MHSHPYHQVHCKKPLHNGCCKKRISSYIFLRSSRWLLHTLWASPPLLCKENLSLSLAHTFTRFFPHPRQLLLTKRFLITPKVNHKRCGCAMEVRKYFSKSTKGGSAVLVRLPRQCLNEFKKHAKYMCTYIADRSRP
uniref:Uncharacterized protein n=1 Tax=Bactrocera dorsalis TaxID=27457 RepID=A0A034W943_BACDO